jgi:ferredoxin
MKIPVVDLSECNLCGVCEDVCPQVFQLNDAGFVEVAELPSYPEPDVETAIRNCPADCISWEDTQSG